MRNMIMSRRSFITASAAIASSTLAAPLRAAPPLRVGVGIDPVYTGFYVAQHEKLFAAEGLDIALQLYTDGGEAMNALVAQQLDVSAAAEPTSFLRMLRAPIRPLAIACEGKSYIKLAIRPDLASPKEIRKFGMVPGTVSQYCAGLAIKALALDPAQIELVTSGPPELPALLARRDIDGFFAWEPWPTKAVSEGGKIALSSVDVGYKDNIWINAAEPALQTQSDALQAILRAVAKGSKIAQEDPKRAATAVKAVAKLPEETTLRLLGDLEIGIRDFTDADFSSYDQIAQFLADQKVTPEVIVYRPMMQQGFFQPQA